MCLEAQDLMLLRVFAMQAVNSSSMGYKASFKYTGIKCNVFVVSADKTNHYAINQDAHPEKKKMTVLWLSGTDYLGF